MNANESVNQKLESIDSNKFEENIQSSEESTLSKNISSVNINFQKAKNIDDQDDVKLREQFIRELDKNINQSMFWDIAFSRLSDLLLVISIIFSAIATICNVLPEGRVSSFSKALLAAIPGVALSIQATLKLQKRSEAHEQYWSRLECIKRKLLYKKANLADMIDQSNQLVEKAIYPFLDYSNENKNKTE